MASDAVTPETTRSLPGWVFPPAEGFAAEHLDHLPDLPARTELIDASLVFVSPQPSLHMRTLSLLEFELRRQAPGTLKVRRHMSVVLGPAQRPEPDVSIVRAEAAHGEETSYQAADVLLAAEVVAPDSLVRDRERKPQLYAEAGIRHHWRVENDAHGPVVYVNELDPATCAYGLTGIHHDRLKLTVPFDLDIDLTEIARL
ncbi:Uma2 family endonuclease [Nonomuraea sp. NPDC003804]|uniref:Uma2 family endonuclease n=1 Tax=Nonomuraea sp. NPDC003804 TaxID=3154547 RepID=UPI00339EC71D